jgi:hypothetical protein
MGAELENLVERKAEFLSRHGKVEGCITGVTGVAPSGAKAFPDFGAWEESC